MKGLSITEVEFPAVVICSEGFDMDAFSTVVFHSTFHHMNISMEDNFGLSPIQFAKLEDKFKNKVHHSLRLMCCSYMLYKDRRMLVH